MAAGLGQSTCPVYPLSKDPIITRTDYPRVTGSQLNIRAFNTPEDLRPTLNRFGLDMEILRMVNWERSCL